MMRMKPETLLLVAGAFWFAAGAGVLSIGVSALFAQQAVMALLLFDCAAVVALAFYKGVFSKMARRNEARILAYEEARVSALRFLDRKGWIVMAVMMGGGMALRASGVAPLWFFAFFYSGLGCALALTGVLMIGRYCCRRCGCDSAVRAL